MKIVSITKPYSLTYQLYQFPLRNNLVEPQCDLHVIGIIDKLLKGSKQNKRQLLVDNLWLYPSIDKDQMSAPWKETSF